MSTIVTKRIKNITKHISFPPALFAKIEQSASSFGVSFAEYLRHLAINDFVQKNNGVNSQKWKEWEDSLPVYTATDEKWAEWDKAKNEKGIVMTAAEFSKHLKNV